MGSEMCIRDRSEFLINKNAEAQVAFIESTQEFVTQLADDSFTDLAE